MGVERMTRTYFVCKHCFARHPDKRPLRCRPECPSYPRAFESSDDASTADATATFHAHLDVCSRCRNEPFNLCITGQRLIGNAVTR